jgi:hypothetical protein
MPSFYVDHITFMLTTDKIRIYKRFNGDVKRWMAETSGTDSIGISKDDWELINDLRKGLNSVFTGRATPEFRQLVETAFLEAAADIQTREAMQELASDGSFSHPILGPIIAELDKKNNWYTQPLTFEGLNFTGQICAFTCGEPPSEAQFNAMINALGATAVMKHEMAERMADVYEDIRPVYIENADRYGEIPELHEPDEIWPLLSELMVFVCDGSYTGEGHPISTTFSFRLGFDPDHEMNVEYRNGQIYEVVCEG